MSDETKRCPYCAEEIKKEAIFCRFCNHDLPAVNTDPKPAINTALPYTPRTYEDIMAADKKKPSATSYIMLFLLLLIIAIVISSSCDIRNPFQPAKRPTYDYPTRRPPTPTADLVKIEYVLSGTAKDVNVTMTNRGGNTVQHDPVYLPQTYTLTVAPGTFLYISAQNNGSSGSVSCTIKADGKAIETATSLGGYVIATCSGSAP